MDERSNLIAQINGLQYNLRQIRNTLYSLKENQLIPLDLHKAINSRVENLLNPWESKLKKDLKTLESQSDSSLNTSWNHLQKARTECEDIFKEFLSFVGGALIRQSQLDNGVCTIADNLLANLSHRSDIPWTRMTILGEGDFFADMTEIIRLRFPELTIWNLPILGHEFGHFVGRELRKRINDQKQRDFLQELIAQEGKQNIPRDDKRKEEDYLYEHLADIFAIYSLGPAFAFTSILLKFNPHQAQDGKSHPSDIKRVYIILKTLEKMNENDKGDYQPIINQLRVGWQESLNQLQEETIILPNKQEKKIVDLLNQRLTKLYAILDQEISNIRYKNQDWLRALRLSKTLTEGNQIDLSNQQYNLIDVLNAAWICRLMTPQKEECNQIALTLCHQIIDFG